MGNVLSKPETYQNDLEKDYPSKRRKMTNDETKRDSKVKTFRMQEEFGAKKFIKP
jgi:hypothetical protein